MNAKQRRFYEEYRAGNHPAVDGLCFLSAAWVLIYSVVHFVKWLFLG